MPATDPTFYRTPGAAVAAAPEQLAYVAAFDPAGRVKDAIAVVDCDPLVRATAASSDGANCRPPATNSTISAGTPARARCATKAMTITTVSSGAICSCRESGRRRTYVLDTKPDPRNPGAQAHHRGRRAGRQGRLLAPAHRALRARRHLHVRSGRRQRRRRPRRGRAARPRHVRGGRTVGEGPWTTSSSPTTSGGTCNTTR